MKNQAEIWVVEIYKGMFKKFIFCKTILIFCNIVLVVWNKENLSIKLYNQIYNNKPL